MKFTQEQEAIINSKGDIKINAVAGSGKTTTIIEYARSRPQNAKILYLAFNKSVRLEADQKFKRKNILNVKVETAHSLAFKHIIIGGHYKVRPISYKTHEIVDLLRLNGGGEKHAEFMIANHINKFISYFCNSAKEKIQDLNYLESISDYKAKEFVKRFYTYIEKQTAILLHKMDMGEIEVTHDFYLKKFQLTSPQLKYDYILFDEGQDASAAVLDVFLKQKATKVIVGDTHQQIYGWRHAVNSLEKVSFKTFNLSSSFRFNQDIADLANRVLGLKNHIEEHEVLFIKGDGPGSEIKTKAVIARTNLGLLLEAIDLIIEKPNITRIYFEGNINSYTYAEDGASLYDVLHLYNGKYNSIHDKIIKTMRCMEDLEEYIDKTEDAQLGIMVEIVKEYGNSIPGLIQEIKKKHVDDNEKDQAQVVFSTVHRCKGMEYDAIQLANDFITEKKIVELKKKTREAGAKARLLEEINLLYVALTRTKNTIHLHSATLPEGFKASPQIYLLHQGDSSNKRQEGGVKEIQLPVKEKAYSVEKIRENFKVAYMPWTPEMDKELLFMLASEKSVKQIAEQLDRSKGAIYSRIKKLEIEKL